jgi:hypothetical protein
MKHSPYLETSCDLECTEEEGVAKLRLMIAETAKREPSVRYWLCELRMISKVCPDLVQEFPFLQDDGTVEEDVDRIKINGTWASEFEFRIAKLILGRAGIKLLVVKSPSMDDLTTECTVEEGMFEMLREESFEYCICLVHLANNHYMYMTHNGRRVIDVPSFRSYLKFFLDEE